MLEIKILNEKEFNGGMDRLERKALDGVCTALNTLGTVGVGRVKRKIKAEGHVGATGQLWQNVSLVKKATPSSPTIIIRSGAPHAIYVEKGTRPHKTSGSNLVEWARRKGLPKGAAYAIAHSIAKKGTKEYPIMEPERLALEPLARSQIEKAIRGLR